MASKIVVQKRYKKRSDWRGLLAVSRDVSFLFGAWYVAVWWGHYPWVAFVTVLWVGVLQFAMGESLLHEASHNNLFRRRWLNKVVGQIIAHAILTTLSTWRSEHRTHHGKLLTEADHLTHDYRAYELGVGVHPFVLWIWRPFSGWVGLQWLRSEGPGLWKHIGVFIFYALVLAVVAYLGVLYYFLLYWVLPLVWIYPAILYWSEITDHYGAEQHSRSNTSFIWNFLFHNGGYHWVHHEYPFIPWYLLPAANEALAPQNADHVQGWWAMYQVLCADYWKRQQST